jgi:hypothetical protein
LRFSPWQTASVSSLSETTSSGGLLNYAQVSIPSPRLLQGIGDFVTPTKRYQTSSYQTNVQLHVPNFQDTKLPGYKNVQLPNVQLQELPGNKTSRIQISSSYQTSSYKNFHHTKRPVTKCLVTERSFFVN